MALIFILLSIPMVLFLRSDVSDMLPVVGFQGSFQRSLPGSKAFPGRWLYVEIALLIWDGVLCEMAVGLSGLL